MNDDLRRYTFWMYGLHGSGVVVGVLSAQTIAFAFLGGIPSLIALIMNYMRRSQAVGTLYASHFRWQRRTFWFALLWVCVAMILSAPLVFLLGLGVLTAALALTAVGLWIAYRVLRGVLALRDNRPMPTAEGALP